MLLLAALGGSARGQGAGTGVPPVANQIVLTWGSLGEGTQYFIQTSTDLRTWVAATNTTATNLSLVLTGDAVRTLRLSASNAPPQSATIAWDPSAPAAGVAGYFIYYRGAAGGYTNQVDVGLATSGVVSNLVAGAGYYFAVAAYTATGLESGYSAEAPWQCPLSLAIQRLP